jgi:hypothetical protein
VLDPTESMQCRMARRFILPDVHLYLGGTGFQPVVLGILPET